MLYIDGLQCGRYDRETLLRLRRGGIDALTVTTAIWEDALETMDAIARWNRLAVENPDLLSLARTADDITDAAASGRVAVILGAQNSSPLNDRIGFVEHFGALGLKVMQLTYNNQNAIGGSCYEPNDSGLTRFGAEVVREMNRVGMLVDLSHVGVRTGFDAVGASAKPVAINHANPAELYPHPRNKPSELLRAVAETGGVVGLAAYDNISGEYGATAQRWCDMVSWTVDLVGIDHVAIGTDLDPDVAPDALDWMRTGRWTHGAHSGAYAGPVPECWLTEVEEFSGIERALRDAARFTEPEIEKLMGGNWLRLYAEVF